MAGRSARKPAAPCLHPHVLPLLPPQEYADFMRQVETDAQAAAAVAAEEEDAEAAGRLDREDFEQL